MSRWFRMYADAMRNPKVVSLSDKDFRIWVGLLAIASENDGVIPDAETCKRLLSMRLDHLLAALYRLSKARLIDPLGDCYEPHNWDKFQYKSDTSTPRVTLHRERMKRKVETAPETDTDTEVLEPKGSCASGDAHALKPEHFVEEWNNLAGRTGKPKVRKLTPERRAALRARINGYTIEEFQEVLGNIETSPFLRGEKGWTGCTFDWVTKKANFQKILEGNYNS